MDTSNEIWVVIPDFPNYDVSSFGRIYSKVRKKILKPDELRNEYQTVHLSKNKKQYSVLLHRVVYEAFCGEIPISMVINHKDENKHNNHIDNLEVITRSKNAKYGTVNARRIQTRRENRSKNGITWWNKRERPCINLTTGEQYPSAAAAAKAVNGSKSGIINACNKKRKTYKKEIWSYL